MKVRVFSDRNTHVIEREFNEWVNDTVTVLEVKYSTSCDAGGFVYHSIAVFYTVK